MKKFLVLPRVRRGEFRWGIVVARTGKELANIESQKAAQEIVETMNSNELDKEHIARLQQVTRGESLRRGHALIVLRAKRYA